jgi:preprotein translocase subunit SecG
VLDGAAVSAPAPAASGAAQIPGATTPAGTSSAVPAAPASAASGAAQIPTK